MNLGLDDDQRALQALAADIFRGYGAPERIERIETTDDRFDAELWQQLAKAGLLGVAVPEPDGGLGLGAVELGLVCEELGRVVAPVPLVATACAATYLSAHAASAHRDRWLPGLLDGSLTAAVAAPQSAHGLRLDGDRLTGTLTGVAWAHCAAIVLVAVGDAVVTFEPAADGVSAACGATTAREVALTFSLDRVRAEVVGDAAGAGRLHQRWLTALCAVQAGVTDAALRLTAAYTSQREQFGKPLSTFQSVALKAADAYLDTTAIRATARQAAWLLDSGGDATPAVLSAAWWAAEAGQRCVHVTQHLHGGMGADITYPVHRYFLWGKQIELLVGGASALLADLGDALAVRPDAGDNIVV